MQSHPPRSRYDAVMPVPLTDLIDADAVARGISRNAAIEEVLHAATRFPAAETASKLMVLKRRRPADPLNDDFPVRVTPDVDAWLREAAAAIGSRPARVITGLCAAHYGYNLNLGGTTMLSG